MGKTEQRILAHLPVQQVLSMNPWDRDELLEALLHEFPSTISHDEEPAPPPSPKIVVGEIRLMTLEDACLRMTFCSMN